MRRRPAAMDEASAPLSARLVIAAWTVPALLSTFETVMFSRLGGRPIELWRAFLSEAPGWYAWAAFTPVIARLATRVPLAFRWRVITLHVACYILVALSASAVWATVGLVLRPTAAGLVASLRNWFVSGLPFTVLVYAAVVGIVYSLNDRARLRLRERDAARLAQQLSEAQLAALRMQLRPHFLFNSLNAIMALVRDGDNARAVSALGLIGEMLRSTLSASSHEVPLAEEVAFTRQYLEMEQLRFGERLRVRFDIPPPLLDSAVPLFVLQPFVENAIKHGILDRRRGGTIEIAASAIDGSLRLSVCDDGVGLAPGWTERESGVGLANARAHLAHLYGGAADLRVGAGASGSGVDVNITLPLRHATTLDGSRIEQTASWT
ncbi:MAG TPA: histidine kinase [Gemmatimonadaceae bacterium]|nr:histidine kinase [Gemmatimonadaceae bacterium]